MAFKSVNVPLAEVTESITGYGVDTLGWQGMGVNTLLSGSSRTVWDVDDDRGGDRIVSGHSKGTGELKKL